MKSTRLIYDQLRDIYDLIHLEEYKKKNPPAKPIKRQNFGKGRPVQPGRDVYADTNPNASRIRLQHKDWDEGYAPQTETPTRKSLRQFREEAGPQTSTTKQDKKNLNFMYQVFLAGQRFKEFEDFVGFVNHLL